MIDFAELTRAVEAHGAVARIVIAGHKGSTPRETGTSMLVFADGSQGTIGGGRLEHDAMRRGRELLDGGPDVEVRRQALGPALRQCCGGRVTLVIEIWDAQRLEAADMTGAVFARRVEGDSDMPDKLRRLARTGETATRLSDGWLVEPVQRAQRPVYIYGAGHVGAALAQVLTPMPEFRVHVADTREDLCAALPDGVSSSWRIAPHEIMAAAPDDAAHFIMTPDHDYDLELCHRVLGREFAYAGLIGSATKWARFRSRLGHLGHPAVRIDQIECPIGDPALGKHPQQIAIGIATKLLSKNGLAVVREDVA